MSSFSKTVYINDSGGMDYEYRGNLGSLFKSVEDNYVVLGTTRYIGGFLCYAYTRYAKRYRIFRRRYEINWVCVNKEDYKVACALFGGNNG